MRRWHPARERTRKRRQLGARVLAPARCCRPARTADSTLAGHLVSLQRSGWRPTCCNRKVVVSQKPQSVAMIVVDPKIASMVATLDKDDDQSVSTVEDMLQKVVGQEQTWTMHPTCVGWRAPRQWMRCFGGRRACLVRGHRSHGVVPLGDSSRRLHRGSADRHIGIKIFVSRFSAYGCGRGCERSAPGKPTAPSPGGSHTSQVAARPTASARPSDAAPIGRLFPPAGSDRRPSSSRAVGHVLLGVYIGRTALPHPNMVAFAGRCCASAL